MGDGQTFQPRITKLDFAKAMLFPIVLAALFSLAHALNLERWVQDRGSIERTLAEWGWRAPLFFITAYSILPLMFVPRAVLALVGGFIFGWASVFYTWGGALIGESMAFGLALFLGGPLFSKIIKGRSRNVVEWLRLEGFWAVVVLRLLPFVPTDVVNFGSGIAGVRYRDYLLGTLLGIFPGCILFSYYGQLMQGEPIDFIRSIPLFAVPLLMGVGVARWRFGRARGEQA